MHHYKIVKIKKCAMVKDLLACVKICGAGMCDKERFIQCRGPSADFIFYNGTEILISRSSIHVGFLQKLVQQQYAVVTSFCK